MKRKFDLTKLAAVVTLAGVLLTGCGRELPEQTASAEETQTQPQTQPQSQLQTQPTEGIQTTQSAPVDVLEILELREEDAWVKVETTWCTLGYPYAFSDLITVRCESGADTARLEFSAGLEQGECPLFYVSFGEDTGILLGSLTLPETGETVSVWAGIYSLEEDLTDADRAACLMCQECVNDMIAFLNENSNFVAEE